MNELEKDQEQSIDLEHAVRHLLEEARMVLPGIQALFGFQMIAVFSDAFERLSHGNQMMHLGAIVLVVISIALVMSPAAIQRHAEKRKVTGRFVELGSTLLRAGMFILAISICVDVYIVGLLVWNQSAGIVTAVALLLAFVALWVMLPIVYQRQKQR